MGEWWTTTDYVTGVPFVLLVLAGDAHIGGDYGVRLQHAHEPSELTLDVALELPLPDCVRG